MNDDVQIRYHDLHKFFQRRHLLRGASLSLEGGVATLLSGENGSGKTTLLRILSGLEKPDHGTVTLDSRPWEERVWAKCRRQLQARVMYLHQQPYMFDGNVIRNLALALPRTLSKSQREQKIQQALTWAQLENHAHARAKTLSGGEKQRVSLARAWLKRSRILLLDEPIANMDRESCVRTVALLKQLKNARTALIIASHNHEVFNELLDHHLILHHGQLLPAQASTLPDNVTPLTKDPTKHSGKARAPSQPRGRAPINADLSAVVLAGGRATRMGGADKGLLLVLGEPLVARICNALAPQVAELLINANRNLEDYRQLGYQVIADRLAGHQGPLAGMHAALLAAEHPWLLTIPCDGPFICTDYAQRMIAAAEREKVLLAVAHDGKRTQPVYSLIHRDLASSLHQFLRTGERKIDRWHQQHPHASVDFSVDQGMFTNINTPQELAAIKVKEK